MFRSFSRPSSVPLHIPKDLSAKREKMQAPFCLALKRGEGIIIPGKGKEVGLCGGDTASPIFWGKRKERQNPRGFAEHFAGGGKRAGSILVRERKNIVRGGCRKAGH